MISASDSPAAWRKSSRSQNGANNCVEVGHAVDVMAVRDSKNPDGAVLVLSSVGFDMFLRVVRSSQDV